MMHEFYSTFMLPLSMKILIIFMIIVLFISLCIDILLYVVPMRWSIDKRMKGISYHLSFFSYKNRSIRYIDAGNSSYPVLLIVHGSPGSLWGALHLLKDPVVLAKYRVIVIDRMGFGRSGFGIAEPSIRVHGDALSAFIEKISQDIDQPITLLGHSYGVPIICYAASKFPKVVQRVICIAGAVDPKHETILPISYPMEWVIFKWMIPTAFKVANTEKLNHINALRDIDDVWERVTQQVDIIHAKDDWLVPVENAYFLKKRMTNASVSYRELVDGGHTIFWKRKAAIEEVIFS
jgi:pimeloyl-ACP methyl ester carboxylesterase